MGAALLRREESNVRQVDSPLDELSRRLRPILLILDQKEERVVPGDLHEQRFRDHQRPADQRAQCRLPLGHGADLPPRPRDCRRVGECVDDPDRLHRAELEPMQKDRSRDHGHDCG